jgi:hypothetical protein
LAVDTALGQVVGGAGEHGARHAGHRGYSGEVGRESRKKLGNMQAVPVFTRFYRLTRAVLRRTILRST